MMLSQKEEVIVRILAAQELDNSTISWTIMILNNKDEYLNSLIQLLRLLKSYEITDDRIIEEVNKIVGIK